LLVFLIGTDDQENSHAMRAVIVSDCLPYVLCHPSSMVHSSKGGTLVLNVHCFISEPPRREGRKGFCWLVYEFSLQINGAWPG